MRNVWKGLVVGGLTGFAAGAALELFDQGSRLAVDAARRGAELGPRAAARLRSAAGSNTVAAEVRAQIHEHPREMVRRLAEADLRDRTREAIGQLHPRELRHRLEA